MTSLPALIKKINDIQMRQTVMFKGMQELKKDLNVLKIRVNSIIDALSSFNVPVVLPAHPRLVNHCKKFDVELARGSIRIIPPLSHRELIATALASKSIITDSGGLQKEAFLLKVPCSTIRTETEWDETLVDGWNILVDDLSSLQEISQRPIPRAKQPTPFGDGQTAMKIIDCLSNRVENFKT